MLTSNTLTDVGAGGLSNALPELLHDTDLGSIFELRNVDNADRGMRYITLSKFPFYFGICFELWGIHRDSMTP